METHRDLSRLVAELPTCLQARVVKGRALPRVEVASPHPHETRQEEELRVVLEYVMTHLNSWHDQSVSLERE